MIPDYQTAMLPTLKALADGSVRRSDEVRDHVAAVFNLSDEELRELVPSGQKTLFSDRVSWAMTYMKKAGLLETPKRAHYRITQRGKQLLATDPSKIDLTVLARYPEFVEWKEKSDSQKTDKQAKHLTSDSTETPEESLDSAYGALRRTIETEILDLVKSMPPAFFEKLVVQLLVPWAMVGVSRMQDKPLASQAMAALTASSRKTNSAWT